MYGLSAALLISTRGQVVVSSHTSRHFAFKFVLRAIEYFNGSGGLRLGKIVQDTRDFRLVGRNLHAEIAVF